MSNPRMAGGTKAVQASEAIGGEFPPPPAGADYLMGIVPGGVAPANFQRSFRLPFAVQPGGLQEISRG